MSDILARLSVYAELGDLSCLAVHPDMPGYTTGGLLRDARDASSEIFKLHALVCDLTAAIQTHHDTKHPRGAAVLAPPDRALYTAAGVAHAVLGFAEGLDERRRAQDGLFTHQPGGMTGYTFRIAWSTDDGEWVGTCDQLPSLSYLHHDPVEAAEWICSLVADYVDELDAKLNPVAPSSGCPFNSSHDFAPTDPCPVCGDLGTMTPAFEPVPESRCVAPVREEG